MRDTKLADLRVGLNHPRYRRMRMALVLGVLCALATFHKMSSSPSSVRSLPAVKANEKLSQALKDEEERPSPVKKHCNFLNGHGLPHKQNNPFLSQSYQDQILSDIFDIIGETNRHAVEFGFGYSSAKSMTMQRFQQNIKIGTGLNIHRLVQKGWKPTLFDAELENPAISLHKAVLTRDNIVDEFRKAGIPEDADFVSVDVDSVDVWLLYGMLEGGYRPRVVSVEFNSNFLGDQTIACEPKWQPWVTGGTVYGASAGAINYVAKQFGYVPVAMVTYLDIFFVRRDILTDTCTNWEDLPPYEALAKDLTGMPVHSICNRGKDASRLVDVPLFLAGKEQEAREKAQQEVDRLNQVRKERGQHAFC